MAQNLALFNKGKKILCICFSIIVYSCNNCEQFSKIETAKFLDSYNTDYSVVVGSTTYNSLKEQSSIVYESSVDNLNKSNSLILYDFDSIHYLTEGPNLMIDYFSHSKGCDEFMPLITQSKDTTFIKCLRLERGDIKCVDGTRKLEFKIKSCSNIMKWHLKTNKFDGQNVIIFRPKQGVEYELVF